MKLSVESFVFAGLSVAGFAFVAMPMPNRSPDAARLQLPNVETHLQVRAFPMFCKMGQPQLSGLTEAQQRSALAVVKLVPGSMGGSQGETAGDSCQGGSGVHLGGGLLITNAHVSRSFVEVNQGSSVEMYAVALSGQAVPAKTLCQDEQREAGWDFALVQLLQPLDIPAARLAQADPQIGEQVAAIGFPLGQAGTKITPVIEKESETLYVPEEKEEQSLLGIVRLDAGLKPGFSGSATFSGTGEIVGLNSMGTRKDVSQARSGELAGGWMIGATRIREFMQKVIDDRSYCRVG